MITEIITITEVDGRNVSCSGSEYFNGCDIGHFPHTPTVGEQFALTSDFIHPSVISEM